MSNMSNRKAQPSRPGSVPERPRMPPPGGGKRPVAPAVPSESAVGEEDPGDFEAASATAPGRPLDPVPSWLRLRHT
ncbi:hypothetical protein, partial [Ralstonia pseudosolanacearum]|uniref:hypothetical protein n=1 Tax=Ralstonia pseudosolanacearum TaxID=1310165 RepID=UPI003222238E